MLHIYQQLSVNNRQGEQSPPPLPPKTQYQGRTMELQASQSRPPAPLPRPDHTLSDSVSLRQHHTTPRLHNRHAMYETSEPATGALLKAPVFMAPPLLQERARMPLPGEGAHQSLAQRRAGPKFMPFTAEMKTERAGDVFGQLKAKTAERLDRNNFITGMNHQRYRDIDTCATTQLFTPEGKGLPANQMKVDGVNLAVRSQYPKPEELRNHLSMLADQKPGVLVVLSSDNDIAGRSLPAYFRQDGHYGDVSVKCKINPKAHIATAGSLELRNYRIEITANGKTTPLSVMHVTNWEDRTTIEPPTLKKLVSDINQKIEQKVGQDPNYSPQPFIHCSAGIGRTGVVAGAIEILKPGNKNTPEEIVLQLRETGSSNMVQTSEQYNTLISLHKEHH